MARTDPDRADGSRRRARARIKTGSSKNERLDNSVRPDSRESRSSHHRDSRKLRRGRRLSMTMVSRSRSERARSSGRAVLVERGV